ncbi:glycoside hydrolase family 3 protein [Pelagibacterium limicola]|uniref:glycoside hydrolase family 3 protein n=1 Tax=Pelagibacterium limicola TaxID=2791022 RepID=UPI0018AFF7AE|nr:glycoside hydrolase family 3 N-terminal domain-containing protein [Pelagibacterium limicola]
MGRLNIAFGDRSLSAAPFNLDDADLAWVRSTFDALNLDQKLGQLIIPICRDLSAEALDQQLALGVGGLHRLPRRAEAELRDSAAYAQLKAATPLLMTCDIEFSEKSSVGSGTFFPNQMAIGATGDRVHATRMGAMAAREAGYLGFNLSWSPIGDLAANFRSSVVNTRAFGADPAAVSAFVMEYHRGARENGFATCLKHWPGDGVDDRDQHFVTSRNSLPLDEWRTSFGKIYADAIADGVQIIMAGHITLPAYGASLGDDADSPQHMPASLNADLSIRLLRQELGFNGVVVSDATLMNGFGACGPRETIVPMCIENGCDILLFPKDTLEDIGHLRRGLETGLLTKERLDQAVLRVLALKASMGLHLSRGAIPDKSNKPQRLASKEHRQWAREASEAAVTLVKDTQHLLPLRPDKHRRILLAQPQERFSPSGPLQPLEIDRLLREAGFEVHCYQPDEPIDATAYDIAMYVQAEEGMSAKEHLGPRWSEFHGRFPASMNRLWHWLPTIYVSLGTPFLLYHMPECKTFVNAYSAILPMQQAVVDALMGKIAFSGRSPVDAFCGLPEAEN